MDELGTTKKMTPERMEAMVHFLSMVPNVTVMLKTFGISRTLLQKYRKDNPEFDQAIKDAISDGYDMIEEEARRRAVDGWKEPIFYKGEKIGDVRKYSDQLLITLLKAYRPSKFNPGVKIGMDDGGKLTMVFNVGSNDEDRG